MTQWTIKALLDWITPFLAQKGVESPRLSAELLVGHVLDKPRLELYTDFDTVVSENKLKTLHDLVKRAAEHEPIATLVGYTEFYSLRIHVNGDCLIPRPETEQLVQQAIEVLRQKRGPLCVLDLCTGSGCIAVAIAQNHPDVTLTATDISEAALAVAAGNIRSHGLAERITLLCGDLFDPLAALRQANGFDLIVCNPPYIPTDVIETLDRNVRDYDPRMALDGGKSGLDIIGRIVRQGPDYLKTGATLLMEIGYDQGAAVRQLIETSGSFDHAYIEKDLQGHDRILKTVRSDMTTT